jgi:hypothetical protein
MRLNDLGPALALGLMLSTPGCGWILGVDDTHAVLLQDAGIVASSPAHASGVRDNSAYLSRWSSPSGAHTMVTVVPSGCSGGSSGSLSTPDRQVDVDPDAGNGPRPVTDAESAVPVMDAETPIVIDAAEPDADETSTGEVLRGDAHVESGWSPKDLPGLVMWLDAAHGLTLSGPAANQLISRWEDQSGHGHDAANDDVVHQPIWRAGAGPNGLPAVMFSRSNKWLSAEDASEINVGTDDFTLAIVAEWTTPTAATPESDGYAALFQKSSNASSDGVSVWANIAYTYNGYDLIGSQLGVLFAGSARPALSGAAALNDGSFRLCSVSRMNGTQLGIRINGRVDPVAVTQIPANANGDSFGSPVFLGGNPSNPRQALTGAISEVVFVHGHLDSTQIGQLETYLLEKYGF